MISRLRLLPFFLAALVLAAGAGCSREARLARAAARGDALYAEGKLPEAEIEYKNALGSRQPNPHVLARLGSIYADQGRHLRALPFLSQAAELRQDDFAIRARLAHARYALGEMTLARADALAVVQMLPLEPEMGAIVAETALNMEQLVQAQEALSRVRQAAGDPPPVLVGLAILEMKERKLESAEALIRQAIKADPKLAVAHSSLSTLLLSRQDFAGAEASLRQAVALSEPRPASKVRALTRLLIQQNKVDQAREVYQTALAKHRQNQSLLLGLAELEESQGRTDAALEAIRRALELDGYSPEAMLASTRLRLARKEFDQAVVEAERITTNFPGWPGGHHQLALVHLARNDTTRAALSIGTALQLNPDLADSNLLLAQIRLQRGEFGEAALALRKLAQRRPDLGATLPLLVDALLGMGDLNGALAVLDDLDRANPHQPALTLKRGQTLARLGRAAEARTVLRRAAELAPNSTEPLETLIGIALAAKDPAEARTTVEAFVTRNPTLATGHLLLGRLLAAIGDAAGAEKALRKAWEVDPDSPDAALTLGRFLASRGDAGAALANVDAALAKTPSAPGPLLLRATLLEQKGDAAAAAQAYEAFLAVKPNHGLARNNLAYLYSKKLNQLEKGQEQAQKARELLPRDPRIADTLGWILYRRGQYPAALALLQESVQQLANVAEVQYHLGVIQYVSGNEAAARNALREALRLDPKLPEAADAQARLDLLDFNAATAGPEVKALLEKELQLRRNDPLLLSRLAELQQRDGALDQAAASLTAALAANPNNARVLTRLARLQEQRNESAKALETAKNARKAAPTDPEIAHLLGRLAVRSGEHTWGLSLIREAARRDANAPDLQLDLAEALAAVGDPAAETTLTELLGKSPGFARAADARAMLDLLTLAARPATAGVALAEAALKAKSPSAPALLASARLTQLKGDPAATRAAFEKLIAAYPDHVVAKRHLAVLLTAAKDPDAKRTLDYANRAREVFPEDAEIVKTIGLLMLRQNNLPRAASLLEEAARKRADDPEIPYHLGLIRRQQKNNEAARQAFTRALELKLAGPAAEDAQKALAELQNP